MRAAGAGGDVVEGPALVARRRHQELARGVHRDARHVGGVVLERVRGGARGGVPDLDRLVRRGREDHVLGRVEQDARDLLGVARHGRHGLAAAAVQQDDLVVGATGEGKVVLGGMQVQAEDGRRLRTGSVTCFVLAGVRERGKKG